MEKVIKILIITLILFIPLVNSHLLDFFGLENIWKYFYLNWNYEFSKVLFFNLLSSLIILLFFTKILLSPIHKERGLEWGLIIYIFLWIIILSNIFSPTLFTSLIWNPEKWHSSMMLINIIFLFIVISYLIKNIKISINLILKTIILSWFITSIIAIKEFIYPSFDYWDLWNRALGTFGHPNYLALFLLITIPIVNNFLNKSKKWIEKVFYSIILFFIIFSLFLTKSTLAIFLFFNYLLYLKFDIIKLNLQKFLLYFNFKIKKQERINYILLTIYILLFVLWILFVLRFYPEKLTSFISRFYIWETTLNITFSDFKILLIWNSLWNLVELFESFKVKELYIFENFYFTADRPHNLFLYILYSFWILWLSVFIYFLIKLYKLIKNNKNKENILYFEIIVLFLLFSLLNFSSIASYVIIIFVISLIYSPHLSSHNEKVIWRNKTWISIFFIITSLFSMYFYSKYFIEEHKLYSNSNYKTDNYLIKQIKEENTEKTIYKNYYNDINKLCDNLILNSDSAENYIYCWNLFYDSDWNKAINYYKIWLNKLPDLWNKNSKYYDNIFINKESLQHRFFSEKYSNIWEVLDRVWIKK